VPTRVLHHANEPPETSAPGHTSQTSFHVPPSIFTKDRGQPERDEHGDERQLVAGHRGERAFDRVHWWLRA
jgi:hypothetical protein